jgi:hypothetical protein
MPDLPLHFGRTLFLICLYNCCMDKGIKDGAAARARAAYLGGLGIAVGGAVLFSTKAVVANCCIAIRSMLLR